MKTSHSKATNPSEGGHWYDQDGNQIGEVERTSGNGYRKPTLTDARKNNWGPGVTTILQCANAPALTYWKQMQTAYASEDRPFNAGYSTKEDWAKDRIKAASLIARQAAEEGTRIHAALESFYSAQPFDDNYTPHVEGVNALLEKHCGKSTPWLPEKGVAHRAWGYGTKADLHSDNSETAPGVGWVLDLKSKDGEDLDDLKTYDTHWLQLAATALALCPTSHFPTIPKQRCAIVYVSRSHPGVCSFVEVTSVQLKKGHAMFKALLDYWQARCGYKPQWSQERED